MTEFYLVLLNSLSSILLIYVSIVLWKKRREEYIRHLFNSCVLMFFWSFCANIELIVNNIESKVFIHNLIQIGTFYAPVETLLFATSYTGILYKKTKKFSKWFYLVQTLGLILVFTNQWHHLIRVGLSIKPIGKYGFLIVNLSALGKFFSMLNFIYMIVSFTFLIIFFFTTAERMRAQVLNMILGMSIAITYSILKLFKSEIILIYFPTSVVFATTSIFFIAGITKFNLLNLTPIARNKIFNIIDYGILISDSFGRIVDINDSAYNLFKLNLSFGKNVDVFSFLDGYMLKSFPKWHNNIINKKEGKFNFEVETDGKIKYFLFEIYIMYGKGKKSIGAITIIKDVTDEKYKNDNLKHKAERDGLTDLYNRQTFIEYVENRLKDNENLICLLYLDIDFFKKINDNYGHMCGDYIIKEVCRIIESFLKDEDIAGRLGGEEFAVLSSVDSEENALEFAENIRKRVEENIFRFEDFEIRTTISIGCALGRNIEFDELYFKADENLYTAKNSGRNCVKI